jgi:hypothetical protein
VPRRSTAIVAAAEIPPNPATFTPRILDYITAELRRVMPDPLERPTILDPFAGPGGIHALRDRGFLTFGVEIEPLWARASPFTFIGDATDLPPTARRRAPFDAIVTSPTYGNRMADHHEARDHCSCVTTVFEVGHEPQHNPDPRCTTCRGTGLSRRHTYRHQLGQPLQPRNTGGMQWGDEYRTLHSQAWVQCFDMLRPEGVLILNVKDHIRGGEFQGVPGWHVRNLQHLGFWVENVAALATGGMLHGANRDLRADAELVITFKKGEVA